MTAGEFKRVANNLFRAGPRNNLQTLHYLIGLTIFDSGVKILFVLAHDHQIHARMFGFDEWMIRNTWPHIRVQTKRLAHRYIQALVAATLRCCDWRLEKNLRVAQRVPGTRIYSRSVS